MCVRVFICIMKCFVSHCEKLGRLFFHCECEKRKASCDDHECFIKHVKYSCLLSWKCCKCFTRRGIGKCKLLPVKCFGIEYHICGACAITMMNELLFEDKKNRKELNLIRTATTVIWKLSQSISHTASQLQLEMDGLGKF